MTKISCFYNCGASGLTLENIEEHYRKFHTKLKSYLTPEFTCDNCYKHYQGTMLYSLARNENQLSTSPHYCSSCANQFRQPQTKLKPKNMNKRILKPKKRKTKNLTKSKLKPRKALKTKSIKRITKAKSTALTLKNRSKVKNTPAYYNCLLNQAKFGFKGKIAKACQACKTNAPALNLAYKKEAQKLVQAYKQLGVSLSKILSH